MDMYAVVKVWQVNGQTKVAIPFCADSVSAVQEERDRLLANRAPGTVIAIVEVENYQLSMVGMGDVADSYRYFLKGAKMMAIDQGVKVIMTCPRCGNSTWIHRDDGFECAACGEFSYPEDMSSKVDESESGAANNSTTGSNAFERLRTSVLYRLQERYPGLDEASIEVQQLMDELADHANKNIAKGADEDWSLDEAFRALGETIAKVCVEED